MRTLWLLVIAAVSLTTLLSSQFGGHLARVLLLGCPIIVAALATRMREHEAPVGRALLTLIGGIAVGQLLAVIVGPRVASIDTLDSLSYFFLTFGVPVVVVLCVVAVFAEPLPDESAGSENVQADEDAQQG